MTLTKEDLEQIEGLIIKVLKSCDNIGHNWEYKTSGVNGAPYGKTCTRCEKYVCDYEVNF